MVPLYIPLTYANYFVTSRPLIYTDITNCRVERVKVKVEQTLFILHVHLHTIIIIIIIVIIITIIVINRPSQSRYYDYPSYLSLIDKKEEECLTKRIFCLRFRLILKFAQVFIFMFSVWWYNVTEYYQY